MVNEPHYFRCLANSDTEFLFKTHLSNSGNISSAFQIDFIWCEFCTAFQSIFSSSLQQTFHCFWMIVKAISNEWSLKDDWWLIHVPLQAHHTLLKHFRMKQGGGDEENKHFLIFQCFPLTGNQGVNIEWHNFLLQFCSTLTLPYHRWTKNDSFDSKVDWLRKNLCYE